MQLGDLNEMAVEEIKVGLLAVKHMKRSGKECKVVSVSETNDKDNKFISQFLVLLSVDGKEQFIKTCLPKYDYMNFVVFSDTSENCQSDLTVLIEKARRKEVNSFLQVKEKEESPSVKEQFSVSDMIKIKNLLRFGKRNGIIDKINETKGELSIESLIKPAKPEIEKQFLVDSFQNIRTEMNKLIKEVTSKEEVLEVKLNKVGEIDQRLSKLEQLIANAAKESKEEAINPKVLQSAPFIGELSKLLDKKVEEYLNGFEKKVGTMLENRMKEEEKVYLLLENKLKEQLKQNSSVEEKPAEEKKEPKPIESKNSSGDPVGEILKQKRLKMMRQLYAPQVSVEP